MNQKNTAPIKGLIDRFPEWLSYFEAHPPFRKYGQLEYHRETIARRLELGSATAAASDEQFQRALYRTLEAWGIGSRQSRLKPFGEFAASISRLEQPLASLEAVTIEDNQIDVGVTTDALWTLQSQLAIVENAAALVPNTKALHHLLPDLVVPMDRQYTQMFFGWHNPQFQYGQRACFGVAFSAFVQIARAVNPSRYVVKEGWNSSRTKVVDNALVGLVQWIKDQVRDSPRPT